MVQIVNRGPGLGAHFGSGFASGVSQGLEELAKMRMQDVALRQQRAHQQSQVKAYTDLNIDPVTAQALVRLPPDIQKAYLQRIGPGDTTSSNGPQDQISQLMSLLAPQQQQAQQPSFQEALQQLGQRQTPLSGQEAIMQALQQFQQPQQQQAQQQQMQADPQQQQMQQEVEPGPKKPPSFGEVLGRPSPGEERLEKRHKETLGQAERIAREKAERPYIEKVADTYKAKKEENNVLKRIIKIREQGKDIRPGLQSFFAKAGIDFDSLKNANELELSKLQNFFLKGATALYGGKVSNAEMFNLLRSVPNLLQTQEGSILLANQIINSNQSAIKEYEIMQRLIKENGGVPPAFLKLKVEEEMEPYYQQYSDDFINASTAFTTLDTFKELPSASQYKGAEVEDEKTGNKYMSDGTKWKRIP